jgi:hypothetical protein
MTSPFVGLLVGLARPSVEQKFNVATEMLDALSSDFGALSGLGKDECPMQYGLCVKSKTF